MTIREILKAWERGKVQMKRKNTCLLLILILVFTLSTAGFTYAETPEELQGELDNVNQQKDEVSARLTEVKKQIYELQPQVDSLNSEVIEAGRKIAETEKAIKDKKEEMANREDDFNARLRVMYKNGSIGFIDVLLNSGSISEFVSNLEMLQKIYKNDMDVLETLKMEQKELEKIEQEFKTQKSELDSKKAELDSCMAEINALKAELEAQEDKLLEEAEALYSKIQSMTDPDSAYIGGRFVWPAPASYYLTSEFGWRIHPIYNTWKYHSGIDIGAAYGTNVVAAASGTVILSQEYGGYGECIMIDHGGGVTTLYGHMSRRLVSVGQTVSAGQLIGKVGDSGVSDGAHLHFEVSENGTLVDPMGYLS